MHSGFNAQRSYKVFRDTWAANLRITVLGPDSDHGRVPGGFSANGQPNDAWHQFLQVLRGSCERAALGVMSDPLRRESTVDMAHNGDGPAEKTLSLWQALQADMFAVTHITEAILRWAWRSRQLVTVEEQAQWAAARAGKSYEEAMRLLHRSRGLACHRIRPDMCRRT